MYIADGVFAELTDAMKAANGLANYTVTLCGYVKNYNGTLEMTKVNNVNATIVAATAPETPVDPDPTPAGHGYSAEDPFTVAEARALIDGGKGLVGAYVAGKISKIQSYNEQYKSITYWISDDGTETDQLQVYSGKGLDGADFESAEDIELGASVVITGTLKKFNDTYEFDKQNYQVLYTAPAAVEYTVTFVGGEGATGEMAAVTTSGGEYTLPACTFTAPDGKEFSGWKVNGEGTLLQPNAKITLSDDIQLVAQWKDAGSETPEQFTISFDANGGKGTMTSVIEDENSKYELPECTFTAPEGKEFAGWKVDGQGELLAAGDEITITADVKLVAQWKTVDATMYTITFAAGEGATGTMAAVTKEEGKSYALPECGFTAPEGKEFAGWKVNGQGDLLAAGSKINVTADVELVAQWKDKTVDPQPGQPTNNAGLPAGAVVGIVIGSVVVVGLGGFSIFWFVIKKKTFADLIAIFKRK